MTEKFTTDDKPLTPQEIEEKSKITVKDVNRAIANATPELKQYLEAPPYQQ